jgi:D-threo-aldose 1-dehydrogenase
METIDLGTTGRKTSRLGYGCTNLMGAIDRQASLRLLEAAFDAGIRHFDVAPSYGEGQAEGCVGEFLGRHRGEVTVTTKYGAPREKSTGLIGLVKSALRSGKAHGGRLGFDAAHAKQSLERSLKELGTDRIDVWLLCDLTADDLRHDAQDEQLLRLMEDSVAAGTIGTFGVASERRKVETLMLKRAKYCRTLQFEWAATDVAVPARMHGFRIHHGALGWHLPALLAGLVEDKPRCAKWSDKVGMNLADGSVLAALMLKSALMENPHSLLLFSAKRRDHIERNVAVAEDASLEAPAHRLHAVLQAAAKGLRAIEAGG